MSHGVMLTPPNFAQAYTDLISYIKRQGWPTGPRNQRTREFTDSGFTIPADDEGIFISKQPNGHRTHLPYLAGEILYYLEARNDVEGIAQHSKFWRKIQNPDGTVNSAYGHLLFGLKDSPLGTQWDSCLQRFRKDIETRQAIMLLHRPMHHWEGNKDVPCTMYLHPMVRNNRLNMTVRMRSSDLWYGLPFDVPFFLLVQENLRRYINFDRHIDHQIGKGRFTLIADSLHIYECDRDKFTPPYIPSPVPIGYNRIPEKQGLFSGHLPGKRIIHPDLRAWLQTNQTRRSKTT